MNPLEMMWMLDLGLVCVKEGKRAVDGVLDVLEEAGVSAEQVAAVAQAAVTVVEVLSQLDGEREEEA